MAPLPPLCLASESPRRAELLRKLNIPFTTMRVDVAEISGGLPARILPLANALRKADAAAGKRPDALILAADTVIALDGRIYGKPADLDEAAAFLRRFSGRMHEVLTGVALEHRASGWQKSFIATTKVWFKSLSDRTIADYLALVPVLDKAGAYAMQDHGEVLIERFDGDPDNVVGLPTAEVASALREFHWKCS